MKRRMMSLLLAMAMLCTLVPTAFARADTMDIEIDDAEVDKNGEYDFTEVYEWIADKLRYDEYDDYYYVDFDDDSDNDTYLRDDNVSDDDYDMDYIELYYVDELYLDVDPDDDRWEGSYVVYDEYDEEKVLEGDITIYFDGHGSGDTDVELTWSYDKDYYFDDDNTDEEMSVYDAIDEILDENLSNKQWDEIEEYYDGIGFYFDADSKSDDVAELVYDEDDEEWYLDIYDTGTWSGTWTAYADEDDRDGEYDSKYDEKLLSGKLYIEVTSESAAGGDITYTALADEDVTMDVDDFEAFWEDEFSKGTLEYVKFDKVSSSHGELVDEDGESISFRDDATWTPRAAATSTWTASPSSPSVITPAPSPWASPPTAPTTRTRTTSSRAP